MSNTAAARPREIDRAKIAEAETIRIGRCRPTD
jgi:hypothetical protein